MSDGIHHGSGKLNVPRLMDLLGSKSKKKMTSQLRTLRYELKKEVKKKNESN